MVEKNESKLLKQMQSFNSLILDRLGFMNKIGTSHSGKRDLYEVFGYEMKPNFSSFYNKYKRQDIAKRICEAFPNAIWGKTPTLVDNPEEDDETEFEKSFNTFAKKNKLFHYLNRLEILANIGSYAVLLVGVKDGKKLDQEFTGSKPERFAYFMPFSEESATIKTYDEDASSPRYGQPLTYELKLGGNVNDKSSSMQIKTVLVHYTRLIHIADGCLENDVFGASKLESIINRLDDLEKVVGGSSELFWINGRGGLNINAANGAVVKDADKMNDAVDEYMHKLSRVLKTQNMDVKALDFNVASPKDNASIILQLISGATGIPQRILTGSEAGELASSQDEGNWFSRVQESRDKFAEPLILRKVVDWLILNGFIPKPLNDDYTVAWPNLETPSEDKKASVALKKAQAITTYANSPNAEFVMPAQQFMEEIMDMDYREDEVDSLIEEERKQIEDDNERSKDTTLEIEGAKHGFKQEAKKGAIEA